jgi:hypothetical protein
MTNLAREIAERGAPAFTAAQMWAKQPRKSIARHPSDPFRATFRISPGTVDMRPVAASQVEDIAQILGLSSSSSSWNVGTTSAVGVSLYFSVGRR